MVWPSLVVQTIKRRLRCGFFRSLLPVGSCAVTRSGPRPHKTGFSMFFLLRKVRARENRFYFETQWFLRAFFSGFSSWSPFAPIPPNPERFPNLFRPLSAQISLFLLVQASKQHSDRQLLLPSWCVTLGHKTLAHLLTSPPRTELTSHRNGSPNEKEKSPPEKRTGNRLLEKGGHLFRHVVTSNRNAREWNWELWECHAKRLDSNGVTTKNSHTNETDTDPTTRKISFE